MRFSCERNQDTIRLQEPWLFPHHVQGGNFRHNICRIVDSSKWNHETPILHWGLTKACNDSVGVFSFILGYALYILAIIDWSFSSRLSLLQYAKLIKKTDISVNFSINPIDIHINGMFSMLPIYKVFSNTDKVNADLIARFALTLFLWNEKCCQFCISTFQ